MVELEKFTFDDQTLNGTHSTGTLSVTGGTSIFAQTSYTNTGYCLSTGENNAYRFNPYSLLKSDGEYLLEFYIYFVNSGRSGSHAFDLRLGDSSSYVSNVFGFQYIDNTTGRLWVNHKWLAENNVTFDTKTWYKVSIKFSSDGANMNFMDKNYTITTYENPIDIAGNYAELYIGSNYNYIYIDDLALYEIVPPSNIFINIKIDE